MQFCKPQRESAPAESAFGLCEISEPSPSRPLKGKPIKWGRIRALNGLERRTITQAGWNHGNYLTPDIIRGEFYFAP